MVLGFALWMAKEGYRESSIIGSVKTIKALARHVDVSDPEAVKTHLAAREVSVNRKAIIADVAGRFYRYLGVTFHKPLYERVQKLPFIPTEEEIDALIAGAGKKTAAFLMFLKQTGARSGEAWALEWTDIDAVTQTVTITPEKGSNSRRLRITPQLLSMLNALPKTSKYVFHAENKKGTKALWNFARNYTRLRRILAVKLQNPRLQQIHFHTFRHWKATALYNQTKDILLVKQTLGHKSITSTLLYTQLVDFKSDEYVCKAAKTVEEASALIELGFDYVTEIEGVKLFRKRK